MWKNLKTFYNSEEWKRAKQIALDKANGLCQNCGEPAEQVHHIKHLTLENVNDYNISLNPNNIIALCIGCHNKQHQRALGNKSHRKTKEKKVFLIWGSPLAGKTTYVKEHMLKGDLILDVDNIWECISLQPRYIHPDSLLKNMFAIRETILDNIKVRKGDWLNAWVIGGFADKYTRDKIIQELGAEPIYIDTTKEECIKRAKERPEGYKDFIEKWWERAEIEININPPMIP